MKLTKKTLKQIILEEISNIKEYDLTQQDRERGEKLGVTAGGMNWENMVMYAASKFPKFMENPEALKKIAPKVIARDKKYQDMWESRPKKDSEGYDPKKFKYHDSLITVADIYNVYKKIFDEKGEISGYDNRQVLKILFSPFDELTKGDKLYFQTDMYDALYSGEEERRVVGLQGKEEIEGDKDFLRKYQQRLRSSEYGKKMIKDFQQGSIAVLHSISYESWGSSQGAEREDQKETSKNTPFSNWYKRYGKAGTSVLSAVAVNNSIESGLSRIQGTTNARVAREMGFVLKGYPVMVSETDVMSQNLGSIGAGLINFHKSSGNVKRASPKLATPILPTERKPWSAATEVLLDNWTVTGVFVNEIKLKQIGQEATNVVQDALSLGLPVYIITAQLGTKKITSIDQLQNIVKESKNPILERMKKLSGVL